MARRIVIKFFDNTVLWFYNNGEEITFFRDPRRLECIPNAPVLLVMAVVTKARGSGLVASLLQGDGLEFGREDSTTSPALSRFQKGHTRRHTDT